MFPEADVSGRRCLRKPMFPDDIVSGSRCFRTTFLPEICCFCVCLCKNHGCRETWLHDSTKNHTISGRNVVRKHRLPGTMSSGNIGFRRHCRPEATSSGNMCIIEHLQMRAGCQFTTSRALPPSFMPTGLGLGSGWACQAQPEPSPCPAQPSPALMIIACVFMSIDTRSGIALPSCVCISVRFST
jgi:hypothetical protein